MRQSYMTKTFTNYDFHAIITLECKGLM